ncbi:MAG: sugar ABC transporter substrate-binding protein [Limnochordales bacterium]|nr:sugar ABC transporter substrate-binding protein [Limnochordales bacterium]
MRELTRSKLVLCATVAAVATLVSFGGGPAVDPAAAAATVTLKFLTWSDTRNLPITEAQIKAFEASHPNIKIDWTNVPSGYASKLLAMIAAGEAPDVFWSSYTDIPMWVNRGVLLDLKPYMDKDKQFQSWKNDYIPILLQGFEYEGGIYGLPNAFNAILLYYNADMFDQAGIKRPDSSWTWEQFIQVAMRLTGPDRYGYADRGEWMHWVWQAGGEVISSDRTRALINQSAAIEGLKFAQDLMHRFRVQPPPNALTVSALEMFARGQIAMYGDGGWKFPSFMEGQLKFDWGVGVWPKKVREATRVLFDGGVVFAGTKHPQEAWEFVKWYSGPPGQEINARLSRLTTPVLKSTVQASIPPNDPFRLQLLARFQTAAYGRLYPSIVQQSELTTIIGKYERALWRAEMTPDQVATQMADEIQKLLDKEPRRK